MRGRETGPGAETHVRRVLQSRKPTPALVSYRPRTGQPRHGRDPGDATRRDAASQDRHGSIRWVHSEGEGRTHAHSQVLKFAQGLTTRPVMGVLALLAAAVRRRTRHAARFEPEPSRISATPAREHICGTASPAAWPVLSLTSAVNRSRAVNMAPKRRPVTATTRVRLVDKPKRARSDVGHPLKHHHGSQLVHDTSKRNGNWPRTSRAMPAAVLPTTVTST